jgi:5-methylcytosine-specific restriction protein A
MTSQLAEIEPKHNLRLMDLVEAAGVDVSDWANFAGAYPASNPKYCYEWSFVKPGNLVALTLWYNLLTESNDGIVTRKFNMRDFAAKRSEPEKSRALRTDDALRAVFQHNLPVRAIIVEGRRRDINNPGEEASKVNKRLLDPATWRVTEYDFNSGECVITRGGERFVDQFSVPLGDLHLPGWREISGTAFIRDSLVRRRALNRANGKCEWCNERGFVMADGSIYLETHHVVPLGEGGPDVDGNVAALCPNHHREVHYGKTRTEMRQELLRRVKTRMDAAAQ